MKELYEDLIKEIETQKKNIFEEGGNIARKLEIYKLSEMYEELKDLPELIGIEEKKIIENRKDVLDERLCNLERCTAKILELS